MSDGALPRDLGDGLVLRAATPADAEKLAAFNAGVHADAPGEPDAGIAVWTRDLLERPHPTFRPGLFTLVEETATGRIASSLNLIPQTWSYGGVEVGVGRIELVGTDPAFRRRGLVRRQMELAHGWSAARGDLLQGITGIPWYYRQFGYEMTLDLGAGRRVAVADVATLPKGEAEPFRLRPATTADLPFLAAADARGRERSLVACVRDAALWRYELDGRREGNATRLVVAMIEAVAGADAPGPGRPVGFVAHGPRLWGPGLWVRAAELAPGESWLAVAPSLLRGLREVGEGYATAGAGPKPAPGGGPPPFARIVLEIGGEHPLHDALPDRAPLGRRPPYAWYVRVPDLPAFLLRVTPVLEARLAASAAAGHTGELKLHFYRDGLILRFAAGRLTEAAAWPEATHAEAGASFPPLTFLHLLVGHRSLADLEYAFADCDARTEAARTLLEALFPRTPSFVWPVS